MPLLISDDVLRSAGLSEAEAKIEIACRLFDAGKLTIGHASRLADLPESDFEQALQARGLPRYRVTEQMLREDIETLKSLGRW
jgi:predicted HTH domain antitoxin